MDPESSHCANHYRTLRDIITRMNQLIDAVNKLVADHTPPDEHRERIERAPVEGDRGRLSGTIAWQEHEEAWAEYAARWTKQGAQGKPPSAADMCLCGGFSYQQLVDLLGHEPKTWRRLNTGWKDIVKKKIYIVAITEDINGTGTMTDDEVKSVVNQWVDSQGAILLEIVVDQGRSSIRVVPISEDG